MDTPSELERGISSMITSRKHLDTWLLKKAEMVDLQFGEINTALADIKAFNAGKKRDLALKALAKWIPEDQKFTAQTKSVDKHIAYLEHSVTLKQDASDYWKQETREVKEKLEEMTTKAYQMKYKMDRQEALLKKYPKRF